MSVVAVVRHQEGDEITYSHGVHVEFKAPLSGFTEYGLDNESQFHATTKSGSIQSGNAS